MKLTMSKEVKGVKEVKTSAGTRRRGWGMTRVIACVFTSLSFFTSLVLAQQTPTFRTRTDLVELDVSVLDKDRRPVRGLTAKDFVVLEDGKPQAISIFEAIDVPDAVPPPVEWMRDVTPDVTTNEVRATRLWVLAIDDALIPQDPSAMKAAKQIVRDIIDKFGPDDLIAVVFTADSRQAQDFTNDRTKLLATLDRFSPGLAYWKDPNISLPPDAKPAFDVAYELRRQDPQFWLGSVLTLRNIVDTFVAIPHARKAMIWVTPGVPFDVAKVAAGSDIHLRLADLTKDVSAIARRGNVPIYPVDPGGLGGLEAFITGKVGNALPAGMSLPPWVLSEDYVVMTAANTGGRAVIKTNEFGPGIDKIFQENSSYYLIGYNPANTKTDGTLRRLQVRVNREDVTVRTRDSYIAPKPGDVAPPKSTNATLSRAMAAPVPVRELPLRATVAPFAIPGGRNAAVAVALGVTQPIPESASKERVAVTTELQVTAFTTEGDNKGTQRHAAKVTLRAGAQGDADYEALSRIDLPPGRYRLRLAAHLASAAKTGTVMVDVIVPDFSRDPASMSGVVLTATPGRPSAPRDLLTDVLPVIPTAQRLFAKADRAASLFYLYQSGTKPIVPAQVAIRITDDRGARLIIDSRAIAIDQFVMAEGPRLGSRPPSDFQAARTDAFTNRSLRAAEVQYAIPIDRLSPGRYLLTFEATVGATVIRRDVQFEVR